jgi:hypothetical protein
VITKKDFEEAKLLSLYIDGKGYISIEDGQNCARMIPGLVATLEEAVKVIEDCANISKGEFEGGTTPYRALGSIECQLTDFLRRYHGEGESK